MKINLWYSKSMLQWRWTLVEEWRNGVTKTEQHSGQQPMLRDAMNDVANTVEYILDKKEIDRFLKIVQNLKKLKSGQLDKLNVEVKKSKLKRNFKKGIF